MKKVAYVALVFLFFISLKIYGYENALLTTAEKSNYTETTRHEDVINILRALQKRSSNIRVTSIGKTVEGRDIPLAILGDPAPSAPSQLIVMKKPAIYIQANIHAGEVEGKEALLMLMREILLGDFKHLLEHQVILVTPNFNPDGNEKISTKNRRNQNGPEGGVGIRYNGQNLDLNRDFIKLESPENLGAVEQILNRWDPILLMDLHTTNGSYHQEPLTYATSHNPNGDMRIPDYVRAKLFPAVAKKLESKYDVLSIPYGYFSDSSDPEKGWRTFNHQPYYSTNYWGLRNRFAILNENYAYADFETRVRACYHFLELTLEFTNKHADEMVEFIQKVDLKTIERGLSSDTTAVFGIDFETKPFPEPLLIRSYEFEIDETKNRWERVKKTDQLKNYRVPFFGDFQITQSIRLPKGYFVPAHLHEIIEKLLQHGLTIETLTEPQRLTVDVFQMEEIESSERIYQGHKSTTIKGTYRTEEKTIPAGTIYVGMDQPLANVAAYLLEPESSNGLVYWNFLDRYLRISQWRQDLNIFPVYRLMEPEQFATQIYTGNCQK